MTSLNTHIPLEYVKQMEEGKRIKIINSDVYCVKCGSFLGMTCDPFRKEYCENCFKD